MAFLLPGKHAGEEGDVAQIAEAHMASSSYRKTQLTSKGSMVPAKTSRTSQITIQTGNNRGFTNVN